MIRSFVLLATLLTLSGCITTLVSERGADAPPPAATPAPSSSATIQAGPMLGYATHREATVWVQTDAPADVQIRYTPTATLDAGTPLEDAAGGTTPVVTATAENDHIARFAISGLEPGVRYAYDVLLDGVIAERPYPTHFATQALWQWRTDPPAFTVALGSCAYVNDPPYDRPGDGYGSNFQIFEAIRAQAPAAMLWLGDNTYLREVDWWSPAGIRYRYAHTRALPEMQALLASTANYATWDDHDYGPNDSDRSYPLKDAALETFKAYWGNPTYGLADTPGVFGQFQWNDIDFFLLDDRYHRTPSRLRAGQREILGERQLEWLLDALTASRAPFKIVAMGGQILNPLERYETYANVAPEERQRLIDGLVERGIEGVVFLSGDPHSTGLFRVQPDGFYPLHDFTSSPLTAGPATVANPDAPGRVPGTTVERTHNFGTLTFSGPRTDRTLTMRTFDADGTLLWTHAIRAADLRVPEGPED